MMRPEQKAHRMSQDENTDSSLLTTTPAKADSSSEILPEWLNDKLPVPVSRALIVTNVSIFAAMTAWTLGNNFLISGAHHSHNSMEGILFFSSTTLENWGSNSAIQTILGRQYWRILTNTFVHLSAFHVAMNMYVLWNFSSMVERLFGRSKFLAIYVISAMGSSVCSLLFLKPESISVGASGAIYGTCGALVAFFVIHRKSFPKAFFRMYSKMFFVCVVYSVISPLIFKDMDNASHLGGFLVGIWAALSTLPKKPGQFGWCKMDFVRMAGLLAVMVCGLVLVSTVDARDPKAIGEYEYAKAVELLKQDQPEEALAHLDNTLRLEPNNATAYLDRAAAYSKLKLYPDAIEDATRAMKCEPNNAKAYLARSIGYSHQEKNDLAIADLTRFIALEPKKSMGYNNRAWSYVVSNKIDEAISDAQKAIQINRKDDSAYDTLGMAYVLQNQYEKAIEQFSECLKREPRETAALYHRAYAYYKLNQGDLCDADLKQARSSSCNLDSFETKLLAPMFAAHPRVD
jgi:membrane associated rhomboid family serine protease/Flp pilus assembly protein TadD